MLWPVNESAAMFASLRTFAAASAVLFLGACFLSESQLIGEGARLQDGPLAFCIDPDEPCHEVVPRDDGYLVLPHPEEAGEEGPIFVRFMPLTQAGGWQIWLGEVELGEDSETAWAYVVVRPAGETAGGVTEYQVAIPSCNEAGDADFARYALERDGSYSCRVSDIAAFADYLAARHSDDFADPDWWDRN